MTGRPWTSEELARLDTLDGLPLRHTWEQFGRSKSAVRVMASRRRLERERVEAARKSRDFSRGTSRQERAAS